MPDLKAIIFDVDGTLADTERDGHRVAFNCAFSDEGLGWNWTPELYGELLAVTGGKERIQFYINNHSPDFKPSNGDLKSFIAGLHASKTRYYVQLLKEGKIPLRVGVKRLIADAREQGIRLAIATTTTPENVTALLESTLGAESLSWFEVIAAGDIVPAKKPDPAIYHYALEQLNLEPDECMAIEDSVNGIKSSLGANLKTVVTVNTYTENSNFSGASLVISDMGEELEPFKLLDGYAKGARFLDISLLREIMNQ